MSDKTASGDSQGWMARLALRFTAWAEKWFPDAYIFAAIAVVVVAATAMLNGATAPTEVARTFGNGFWSTIVFSMQMAFVAITGYVIASSPGREADHPPGRPAEDRPGCRRRYQR